MGAPPVGFKHALAAAAGGIRADLDRRLADMIRGDRRADRAD